MVEEGDFLGAEDLAGETHQLLAFHVVARIEREDVLAGKRQVLLGAGAGTDQGHVLRRDVIDDRGRWRRTQGRDDGEALVPFDEPLDEALGAGRFVLVVDHLEVDLAAVDAAGFVDVLEPGVGALAHAEVAGDLARHRLIRADEDLVVADAGTIGGRSARRPQREDACADQRKTQFRKLFHFLLPRDILINNGSVSCGR